MAAEVRPVVDATLERGLAAAPVACFPAFARVSISVVARDLDPRRPFRRPGVTDQVLVVDSDGILSLAISGQLLPPVAWWKPERIARYRGVQLVELATSDAPHRSRTHSACSFRVATVEDIRCAAVPKRPDHRGSVASAKPIGL